MASNAFTPSTLGRVTSSGNANHPTVWSYEAGNDTYAQITASAYVTSITTPGLVKVGDILIVTYASKAKCTLLLVTASNAVTPLATTSATTNT